MWMPYPVRLALCTRTMCLTGHCSILSGLSFCIPESRGTPPSPSALTTNKYIWPSLPSQSPVHMPRASRVAFRVPQERESPLCSLIFSSRTRTWCPRLQSLVASLADPKSRVASFTVVAFRFGGDLHCFTAAVANPSGQSLSLCVDG